MIFTANATAAIKLVGESFPFREGGAFVLGTDSHNSINGIRRFAAQGGAKVCYLGSTNRGGVDVVMTEVRFSEIINRKIIHKSIFRTFSSKIDLRLRILLLAYSLLLASLTSQTRRTLSLYSTSQNLWDIKHSWMQPHLLLRRRLI